MEQEFINNYGFRIFSIPIIVIIAMMLIKNIIAMNNDQDIDTRKTAAFGFVGIIMLFVHVRYGDEILIMSTIYTILAMFGIAVLLILLFILTAVLEARKNNDLLKKSFINDEKFFTKNFPQYKFEIFKELFFIRDDFFNKEEHSKSKEIHKKLNGIVSDINAYATKEEREVATKVLSFYGDKNSNYKLTKILLKCTDFGEWFLMKDNNNFKK